MIALSDVQVRSGGSLLVDVDGLALSPGSAVTLVGESGSGKSLLAQALIGNLPPGLSVSGTLTVDGEDSRLGDPANRRLWGRRIVQLPQEPTLALDPTMRVLHQVAEGHPSHAVRRERRTAVAAATARLDAVGLPSASRGWPHALSGGMAQRVAFAAATVGGAPLLIADEPTKGLDEAAVDTLAGLLEEHLASGGSLLTVTHDLDLARRLGGHVMVMRDAVVIESGPAERVLETPGHAYTHELLAAEPRNWDTTWARATPADTLLRGRGLSKQYGDRVLFADVDVDLAVGERVALTGPSGSGKTTLGNVLTGLLAPDTGRVERTAALRPGGVQKLYQDPVLSFPPRVALRTAFRDVLRRHRVAAAELSRLVEALGLDDGLLERRPAQVSGGELQRLAIIRAMLVGPQVLLADEPTSRLDPVNQQQTIRCLMDAVEPHGTALVMVTHDRHLAAALCERSIGLG